MIERAVVTGASGGIGAACVAMFHASGAEVVGVDTTPTSTADDHVVLDLANPDCGIELLETLAGRAVDVLVNNAAIGLNRDALETDSSDFDHVIAVNLRAPFLLAKALHPTLSARRGSIVNVASVHAVATSHAVSVYAASKGGLVSLTRALALEWAPEVRVNCVLPGAVATQMLDDGLVGTAASIESLGSKHPMERVGRPDEIAEGVVFLATNRFTTGTTLIVDGGATARLSTE